MTAAEEKTISALDSYRAALVTLDVWRERVEGSRSQYEQAVASMLDAESAAKRAHEKLIAALRGES